MSLLDNAPAPRRTMVLFFVVDTSGSMQGSKIGSVNAAIDELIPDIRDLDSTNPDARIKIAALQFDSDCRWITSSGPIEADKFQWNYIDAEGVTDFGAACKELNIKLDDDQFMSEATGSYAPVIILLSDGEPTDNWQPELDKLKKNNWFKFALKYAFAVGHDANHDVLKEFTGNSEAVLEVNNTATLKRMIHFVSVRASQFQSQSAHTGADTESNQVRLDQEAQDEAKEAAVENPDDEW
jgi:uncharacterized protein YegL